MVDTSRPKGPNHVERIHAFDLLRGFFLIIILLDHLAYYPSGLDIFTGRGMLFVSSAEGFFLISGIVLGIVRGRKLLAQPFRVAAKKLFQRSIQLYLTSVILTLLFTFIGWLFFMHSPGLKYGIADQSIPLWKLVWETMTFRYTYGWADFLRYYAIFIAAAIPALWLLRRGLWYVVALASGIIWWYYTLTPGGLDYLPYSWQIIFFAGFVIGYYWPMIVRQWRRLPSRLRAGVGVSALILFVATAILSACIVFGAQYDLQPWDKWEGLVHEYFDKDRMPIPRLLLGTIWFWGLFWLVRRFEQLLLKKIGWFIIPLGVNSLYAYTIEAFVVFFFHALIIRSQAYDHLLPWYANLALSFVAIGIVWLMTKRQILFKIIPR